MDVDQLREAVARLERACIAGMDEEFRDDVIPLLAHITKQDAENAELRDALQWYAEQVAGCRKIGSIGEPFRHSLDADGGERAINALAHKAVE